MTFLEKKKKKTNEEESIFLCKQLEKQCTVTNGCARSHQFLLNMKGHRDESGMVPDIRTLSSPARSVGLNRITDESVEAAASVSGKTQMKF